MSGDGFTHRRLVPRHRWPEAADRLQQAKAPHLAEAHHDHHAVLVRTSRKGAARLDGISSTVPAGIGARTSKPLPKPPPEPPPGWAASDPLEAAFKRMQAEAKARTDQLDQEAAA